MCNQIKVLILISIYFNINKITSPKFSDVKTQFCTVILGCLKPISDHHAVLVRAVCWDENYQ